MASGEVYDAPTVERSPTVYYVLGKMREANLQG